jgi:hypothetical protein
MNNQFDQLARSVAESVSRRQALRRFGAGLAASVLAAMGFASKAGADPGKNWRCHCKKPYWGCDPANLDCFAVCSTLCSP